MPMKMIYAPKHIKKYVRQITGSNKFFHGDLDKFTFAYEVICSCGNKELVIFKNSEPKVTAYCESCGERITIYDLIEYPCAVTARKNGEDTLEKVIHAGNDKFNVAVIFEYSDEFGLDDEYFNEDDVTWCQIYLYDSQNSQSILIIDDETA